MRRMCEPSLRRRVDWSRMAEPQRDGYDTDRIVELVGDRRRPDGPRCAGTWFDVAPVYAGRAAFSRDFGGFDDAPATHPNLSRAVALVEQWPVGGAQARRLIAVVHPALDPDVDDDLGWDQFAAASHSYEDAFGTLWVTVHSPLGVAEAIVHEMAHHKLRACGVRFESADAIVANLATERHPSAILRGLARPMPAVLHGFYAVLHVVALELAILAGGDERQAPLVRRLLRRNGEILASGRATLRRHLVVDEAGATFVPAMFSWHDRLAVEAGQA
jgi:HEXXH motif-containing protein